jgi:hypothetical protein
VAILSSVLVSLVFSMIYFYLTSPKVQHEHEAAKAVKQPADADGEFALNLSEA